jgi:hypothetical protein
MQRPRETQRAKQLVLAGDLLLNREQEGDLLSWLPVVGLLNENDY